MTMKLVKQFNPEQMRMIHNLILSVNTKQEMFDYLICKLNLNYSQAIAMSNTFNPVRVKGCNVTSFTVLTIHPVLPHRVYSQGDDGYSQVIDIMDTKKLAIKT